MGPTSEIAETFGEMYEWARRHGQAAGQFKLDFGYTIDGDEREHDLFIGIQPAENWRSGTI